MKKRFCEYCGTPIADGCDCLKEAADEYAATVEEIENRPDTQYGWYQQDMIDLHRMER
jgi:hypothetical protein